MDNLKSYSMIIPLKESSLMIHMIIYDPLAVGIPHHHPITVPYGFPKMWFKQFHKPPMTGNGKFIPHIRMVMIGGWFLALFHREDFKRIFCETKQFRYSG